MKIREEQVFGIARKIKANMTGESWSNITHSVVSYEADVTELMPLIKEMNAGADKAERITVNSVMLKIITEGIKAMPLDWEIDSEGKHVVVNKFAFDSKNLYKATGLEKSEVVLRLPRKLSVASFQGGVTKLEIERNESLQQQISEAFGDYSDSYNVSGGKLYYRSENQAKGVVLLFWHESGQLIVETLSE